MLLARPLLALLIALPLHADSPTTAPSTSPDTSPATTNPAATLPTLTFPAPNPSASDLPAVESAIAKILPRAIRTTIGLRIGSGQGTGVIISPDGLILTAGHVSELANKKVEVIYHDGSRATATTLGANHDTDTGLARLDNADNVEFSPVSTAPLVAGQWTVAIGQPGGYQAARSPVVRVGRILRMSPTTLITDNSLVGGDSGGPLFDLAGNVIAIHSRIGQSVASNVHVPASVYVTDFPRLLAGEVWGQRPTDRIPRLAYMGLTPQEKDGKVTVQTVAPNSPAAAAGIQPNDTILTLAGQKITTTTEMLAVLAPQRPGNQLQLTLLRGDNPEPLTVTITLARRPTTQP